MQFRRKAIGAKKSNLLGDIVLTNMHTTRAFLALSIDLFSRGITWLVLGSFARTGQVSRSLRHNSGLVYLAPAVNSRVTSGTVKIGDVVEANANLAEIKNTTLTGNRLDAIQGTPTGITQQIENAEHTLSLDQQDAARRRETLKADLNALNEEIEALSRSSQSQAALLVLSNERLAKLTGLAGCGFATDVDIKSLQAENLSRQSIWLKNHYCFNHNTLIRICNCNFISPCRQIHSSFS